MKQRSLNNRLGVARGSAIRIAIFLGLTACSSSTGNFEGHACPDSITVAPPLLLPANGATGVSTSIGNLYFGGGPSSLVYVVLTPASGSVITGGTLTSIPSPAPPGTPSGAVTEASIPSLSAEMTYRVSIQAVPQSGQQCPLQVGGSSGSFTTQ